MFYYINQKYNVIKFSKKYKEELYKKNNRRYFNNRKAWFTKRIEAGENPFPHKF